MNRTAQTLVRVTVRRGPFLPGEFGSCPSSPPSPGLSRRFRPAPNYPGSGLRPRDTFLHNTAEGLSPFVRWTLLTRKSTTSRMDTLTRAGRSERMSRVKSKDTKPEVVVRKLTHRMGFRYRLHVRTLPGAPDLVFRSRRKVIFVHGCFWHRHKRSCPLTRWPKSKLEFWKPKLEENRKRDQRNRRRLRRLGWEVLVIWECELADLQTVARRVENFLGE